MDEKNAISLNTIRERKAILKGEIGKKGKVIKSLSKELIAPMQPAATKGQAIMRAVSTGMTAIDGIIIGMRVVRRLRKLLK